MGWIDFLFPRFCLGCGWPGVYLCDKCLGRLRFCPEICFYCARRSWLGKTHHPCLVDGPIDGWSSLFYYDRLTKKIIGEAKYRQFYRVLHEFCFGLGRCEVLRRLGRLKDLADGQVDYYLPVPLHPQKHQERGFNQADIIAAWLQGFLPRPLFAGVERVRPTLPQAQQKTIVKRRQNLRRAFRIINRAAVVGKTFLVVDDVVTSGATVTELARALKIAGAARVYLFTLARGRRN
ncbi:hypothetical protein M1523_04785 [Patescibacteria group bacterium]|nr:hypothetical protein [Patescibacteria group bacterium]